VQLVWPFRAQFALLSKRFGRQTLSARYDRFEVDSNVGDGSQIGHAWTAAWLFDADAHWRLALEWLRVQSSSYDRADLGGPPLATETQLQLAVRYAFGSGVR
jgi:phosphate-selective porin